MTAQTCELEKDATCTFDHIGPCVNVHCIKCKLRISQRVEEHVIIDGFKMCVNKITPHSSLNSQRGWIHM